MRHTFILPLLSAGILLLSGPLLGGKNLRAGEESGMYQFENYTRPGDEVQTSEYWYRHPQIRDSWATALILDPDGWRGLRRPKAFWYYKMISREEFSARFSTSSMVGGVNDIDHEDKSSPF